MLIYCICHDANTHKKAIEICKKYSNKDKNIIFLPLHVSQKSPYFENIVFFDIQKRKNEWEKEDFVGIISYSFENKIHSVYHKFHSFIDWEKIRNDIIQQNLDCIGILRIMFEKNKQPYSLLNAATSNHGYNFYRAWKKLLQKLHYTKQDILDPHIPFYVSNWWIMKPYCMDKYIDFMEDAVNIVENDENIKTIFDENSYYKSCMNIEQTREIFGKNYFTLHPFIFERLSNFFFYKNPNIKLGQLTFMDPHIIDTYN